MLGLDMALCAIIPILYALFGNYLPYIIGHKGYSVRRIIEYVYLTSDGVFGIMAEVLASFIIPFVAFGAFLERAGVAKFFVDISLGKPGANRRRPGTSLGCVESADGNDQWQPDRRNCYERPHYHTADETRRLSSAYRRSS